MDLFDGCPIFIAVGFANEVNQESNSVGPQFEHRLKRIRKIVNKLRATYVTPDFIRSQWLVILGKRKTQTLLSSNCWGRLPAIPAIEPNHYEQILPKIDRFPQAWYI
jgi:hypothetical protein